MLAGELYLAEDLELAAENKRASRLLRKYNSTTEEQQEQRQQILQARIIWKNRSKSSNCATLSL